MEREARGNKGIIKRAAIAVGTTAVVLTLIEQGIAESPIENQNWLTEPKPQGIEEPYVPATSSSPLEVKLLRQIDSLLGAQEISRASTNNSPSIENVQESLMPGDIAPETWGGAGIFDVMSVVVQDLEFTGQVIFLHKHGLDGFTYTLLAGRTATGEIVKGSNFKAGFDSMSSSEELNLSLGGDGGAQLRYDRETKDLTFWMQGFPVSSPENPQGRRISFVSEVKVDQRENGKSRVLHQPLPSETLEYYMRSGSQSTTEGEETTFLLVAHTSLREIPSTMQALPEGLPLVPPLSVVSFPDKSLYVVQPDSQTKGVSTSFVWQNGGDPDLQAETIQDIGFDKGHPSGKVFPVPKKLDVLVNDQERIEIKIDTEPTDSFGFSITIPNLITGKEERILVSLPQLQAYNGEKKGLLYTQTIGVPAIPYQPLKGDVNRDGRVDGVDLRIVTKKLGTKPPAGSREDVNGDGVVDAEDLTVVAKNFGRNR